MPRVPWHERIVADPEIHDGDPCIKGTRIPVTIIIGSLADGMSASEVIDQYPQLVADDTAAALDYAAGVLQQEQMLPLAS